MADKELEEKKERLASWFSGGTAPPYGINIAPTERCNLRCIFCSRSVSVMPEHREVDRDRLISIIREAGRLGAKLVNLSGGGEPFVRAETTMAILNAVKGAGMGGGFTTNGTLLAEAMIENLVRIDWDTVNFSIDAPDRETHEQLRAAPGMFDRSLEAIRRFQHWKARLGKMQPHICINSVLVRPNFRKVEAMMRLARELGIFRVVFIPLTTHDATGEGLKLTQADTVELQDYIPGAREIANAAGIETNIDDFLDFRMVNKTNEMIDVFLDPDGEVGQEAPSGHGGPEPAPSRTEEEDRGGRDAGTARERPEPDRREGHREAHQEDHLEGHLEGRQETFRPNPERPSSVEPGPTPPERDRHEPSGPSGPGPQRDEEPAGAPDGSGEDRQGSAPAFASGAEELEERLPPCFEPWLTLVIHPDGNIDPCEHNNRASGLRERSLEEIWLRDPHLNRLRDAIQRKDLPGFCALCCEPVVARNLDLREALISRLGR